jgi:hypothetical protein
MCEAERVRATKECVKCPKYKSSILSRANLSKPTLGTDILSEVITVVIVRIAVFWFVTPFGLVEGYILLPF